MTPKYPIMNGLNGWDNRHIQSPQFSCVLWHDEHHAWWGGIMSYGFQLPSDINTYQKHSAQYIVRVTLKPQLKSRS